MNTSVAQTSQLAYPDQVLVELQHRVEKLYILAKTREIELARLNSVQPIFGMLPPRPGPIQRLLFRSSPRRRRRRNIITLRDSGLFSLEWYLSRYPDVADAGINPAAHFLDHGADELRDPGPYFSTRHYLNLYPDVRDSGINPLLHYVHWGWREKRSIRPGMPHGAPI
jgi:hypothetical protein